MQALKAELLPEATHLLLDVLTRTIKLHILEGEVDIPDDVVQGMLQTHFGFDDMVEKRFLMGFDLRGRAVSSYRR